MNNWIRGPTLYIVIGNHPNITCDSYFLFKSYVKNTSKCNFLLNSAKENEKMSSPTCLEPAVFKRINQRLAVDWSSARFEKKEPIFTSRLLDTFAGELFEKKKIFSSQMLSIQSNYPTIQLCSGIAPSFLESGWLRKTHYFPCSHEHKFVQPSTSHPETLTEYQKTINKSRLKQNN